MTRTEDDARESSDSSVSDEASVRSVPRRPLGTATMTVVVGFVGLIASLFVLGSIAEGVRAHEVFALDTWATPFLHGISSPGLDAVMGTLTDIGSSLVIIPLFVVVVAALLWKRRYGAAAFLGLASGGALVLDATIVGRGPGLSRSTNMVSMGL
jgi:hypothetical protein